MSPPLYFSLSLSLSLSVFISQELEIEEGYTKIGIDDLSESDPVYEFEDEPEMPAEPQSPIDLHQSFNYSIRIMNPSRMTDYHTVELSKGQMVRGIKSLRQFVFKNLPTTPDFETPDVHKVEMGYVEPGHGTKGGKV